MKSTVAKLLLVTVLAMCASGVPAEVDRTASARFYEDAVSSFDNGDLEVAVVHLKNAIQKDQASVPAHLLLSRVYLKQGQGALAEASAKAAARHGADRLTTIPLFAQAYLQQFKYAALLDELDAEDLPEQTRSELLLYRGQAYLEIGDLQRSSDAFDEAIRLARDTVQPYIGKASVAVRKGDLAAAQSAIETALARDADSAEAWNVQASIQHVAGDLERAIQSYGKALKADPLHREARVARVALQLDLGRDAETRADLQFLGEKFPDDPRAAYLRALKLSRAGDAEGARSHLAEAAIALDSYRGALLSSNAQLLMLGGLVHYGLAQFDQAAEFLERLVALRPNDSGARKLLGSVYLRTGAHEKALNVLTPAKSLQPDDAQVLTLIAGAWMGQGRHDRAAELLSQALALPNATAEVKTQLAFARLQSGDTEGAMELLDKVIAEDPAERGASLFLAVLQHRRGNFVEAERLARELLKQSPDNLTALNILGASQAGQGNVEGARSTFVEVLKRDSGFAPAVINLANLDAIAGRYDAARSALAAQLNTKPHDQQLLMALARLEMQRGDSRAAVKWLEQGRVADTQAVPIRVALADILTRTQDFAGAEKVLAEAIARAPADLTVLHAQARLALVRERAPEARVLLKRMADIAAFDSRWLVQIAELQHESGAVDDARHSLRKALQSEPDSQVARVGLADLALEQADADGAAQEIAEIANRWPDAPVSIELQGHLAMLQGRHADAITSYTKALQVRPHADTVVKLSAARLGAGDPAGALSDLRAWVNKHPQASGVRHAWAETLLRTGDLDGARAQYEEITKQDPKDIQAWNNLANIAALRDDKRALEFAQRAYAGAPYDADVLDTLGWILVRAGRPDEGLRHLRDAHARDSGSPVIRYHLALALEATGRTEEARREVVAALATNVLFPGRADAEKLRERLR